MQQFANEMVLCHYQGADFVGVKNRKNALTP